MSDTNVIKQDTPKELNALKNSLYISKVKRLNMIDSFIDKIRKELDKRDLTEIPTPQLSKMLIDFADLAKKEQPVIELQYSLDDWSVN